MQARIKPHLDLKPSRCVVACLSAITFPSNKNVGFDCHAAPGGPALRRPGLLTLLFFWCCELLFLVGIRLEERVEVAHREVVAPDDPHVGDGLTVFIQSLDGCDDVVEVLLGEAAAVDGEADDVGQLCQIGRASCRGRV